MCYHVCFKKREKTHNTCAFAFNAFNISGRTYRKLETVETFRARSGTQGTEVEGRHFTYTFCTFLAFATCDSITCFLINFFKEVST